MLVPQREVGVGEGKKIDQTLKEAMKVDVTPKGSLTPQALLLENLIMKPVIVEKTRTYQMEEEMKASIFKKKRVLFANCK